MQIPHFETPEDVEKHGDTLAAIMTSKHAMRRLTAEMNRLLDIGDFAGIRALSSAIHLILGNRRSQSVAVRRERRLP